MAFSFLLFHIDALDARLLLTYKVDVDVDKFTGKKIRACTILLISRFEGKSFLCQKFWLTMFDRFGRFLIYRHICIFNEATRCTVEIGAVNLACIIVCVTMLQ